MKREEATMYNDESPMNREQSKAMDREGQKMSPEEEAVMLTALTRKLCALTVDYVETVRKMFQTYPELRKAFDIVAAMNLFDNNVIRCIQCKSSARDRIVVELQSL